MPSFGAIRLLSAAGLAAAGLGVAASAASAGDVWLWACHGPNGQPVAAGSVPHATGDADVVAYGSGCAGVVADGGLQLRFSRVGPDSPGREPVADPAGGSSASLEFESPSGASLVRLLVLGSTHGLGTSQAGSYAADLDGVGRLEPAGTDLNGEVTYTPQPPGSGSLTLSLSCDRVPICTGGSVNVARVGMLVSDTTPPAPGGVARSSPVDKTMTLQSQFASDDGAGLDRAEVTLDGASQPAAVGGFGGCAELSPGDGTVDRALGGCPADSTATLTVDTSGLSEGAHRRTVTIFDAAGNSKVVVHDEEFQVFHPAPGTNVRTLAVGTGGSTLSPATRAGAGAGGSGGGVAGATSTSCRAPKLSMFLAQSPLRVSKGVAVLRRAKRYRFNGRLTCVIDGKRRPAPRRTRIDVLNTVGKRTVEKAGTTARDKGKLTIILAYKSSRTLIFRVTNSDGQRSQVRIKVRVVRKPKR